MNNVQNKKRADKNSLPFFFTNSFKVSFLIILISTILLIVTFTFDIVPPILNRGIQPATFPKALLILIIFLTSAVYYLSLKFPWKKEKKLPKSFYITLHNFIFIYCCCKNSRFFFSYFSFIIFSFIFLGWTKNYLLTISKHIVSYHCICIIWNNFGFKISTRNNY